jgi:hypothetical protein
VVGVALALLPCAIGAGVATVVVKRTSGRIGRDEARAAARETNKSALRDRLGAPAGHGEVTLREGTADCLVYVDTAKDRWGDHPKHFFCFRDGVLVETETW